MIRDTVSKAVLMPTGPCGPRVPGRSCVTFRLAPAVGSARYAIQGGCDLALVALTPPPSPRKSRIRARIDTSGQFVGGQGSEVRGTLFAPLCPATSLQQDQTGTWGTKVPQILIRHPISDIHNTSHNHRRRPKRRWRSLNHDISNGSKRRHEAVTAKISEG